MKDAFLATLSHELRTPLNAIVGWAHLLSTGSLAPETRRAVEIIKRNAEAQTQLISDLLDISRIQTGKVQLHIQSVDLARVVEASLESMAPAAAAKGIEVRTSFADELPSVAGDADRLQQIAWNLLSNAVKFTPGGGRVEVQLLARADSVRLEVRDNGAGIAPDFLPFVFEPFRQQDASPTRAHGGLGLGLAIVRHLVELHGGTISVESPGIGQGATIAVDLPVGANEAPAGPERAVAVRQPNLYGLRVLVVEDDEDSRTLITEMLARFGVTATTAASADEGLTRLRVERPDVLVSGLGMAEEGGYDLIRQVRALPLSQGGLTPAIALTAFARVEDRRLALSTGFQVHVARPVRAETLATAIARITGRRREV
jgi:CheY-like chemotaxis protein/two-component sensor histidine kinase